MKRHEFITFIGRAAPADAYLVGVGMASNGSKSPAAIRPAVPNAKSEDLSEIDAWLFHSPYRHRSLAPQSS